MNGMKAKKCEQTRMQLCDRRYLEIEHVNNFISQRLQVGNLAKLFLQNMLLLIIFLV